jgi:hypothetical protein
MMKVILLCVAVLSAHAMADSTRIPISIPGKCQIKGWSYQLLDSSTRGVPSIPGYRSYVPGDTVPSRYSNLSIEARLMAGFNALPGESGSGNWIRVNRLRRSNIVLIAEYDIGEPSDVVILKYGVGTSWNGAEACVYVAYVKSADDVFPLVHDSPAQLRGFDDLLAEHPNALNLSPTCKAFLVASLYADCGPLIILDSQSDIAIAARLHKALIKSADFQKVFNIQTLFRTHIASDSLLQEALHDMQADDITARLMQELSNQGIRIDPPRILSGTEDDTVKFTAYDMGEAKFSQWLVVVSKLGFVKSIESPCANWTRGFDDVALGQLRWYR